MDGIPHLRYNHAPSVFWKLRKKPMLLYFPAIIFGCAHVGAFAPFNYWWLTLPSIMFLLWIFDSFPTKTATKITFVYGVAFWVSAIHWIVNSFGHYANIHPMFSSILVFLLCMGLAFFWVILLYTYKFFTRNIGFYRYIATPPLLRLFVFAASWCAVEWLRNHLFSGFPWLLLGYALIDIPYIPLQNYLPIGGILSLGFIGALIIGTCYFFFHALFGAQSTPNKLANITLLLLLVVSLVGGSFLLPKNWSKPTNNTLSIALVQPSIPLTKKWGAAYTQTNLEELYRLSFLYRNTVDVIVWPESAIADVWQNHTTFLSNTVASLGDSHFVSGSLRFTQPDAIYNSIITFSDQPLTIYDKRQLVPFGEFVPFFRLLQDIISFFGFPANTLSHSQTPNGTFIVDNMRFTAAICYEIIFSSLINRDAWRNEALLNISDDGWFGNSIGPSQHFQMARARAIEQSRPLVRVGNDGITALVDHHGKIQRQLPRFAKDVLVITLEGRSGRTLYSVLGDWIILLLCIPILLQSILVLVYRKRIE